MPGVVIRTWPDKNGKVCFYYFFCDKHLTVYCVPQPTFSKEPSLNGPTRTASPSCRRPADNMPPTTVPTWKHSHYPVQRAEQLTECLRECAKTENEHVERWTSLRWWRVEAARPVEVEILSCPLGAKRLGSTEKARDQHQKRRTRT